MSHPVRIPDAVIGALFATAAIAIVGIFYPHGEPLNTASAHGVNGNSFRAWVSRDAAGFLTLCLFICSVAQLLLFYWQLGLLRRSVQDAKGAADAAMSNAKTAERAFTELERPWLFLEGATITRRDPPNVLNSWFIKLHWRNIGRSPALVEQCLFDIMPTPLLLPEPVYSEIKELPCARTVRVDEAVETHQVGPAPRRRENLTVFGKIIYSELNGKRHETGYALEVSPNIAAYNVYASDKYSFYS